MSDDSFIREVNDEIRREQAQALWDRFGPAILGLAILVVLGTAAFVGYRYWDESRANRSGDAFSQALKLANDGKSDDALTADNNTLRHTAREALGLAAWKEGKTQDALKLFDQIAADDGAPRNTRERATLMSELIRGSGNAS